jgi:hypothetical protein
MSDPTALGQAAYECDGEKIESEQRYDKRESD